MKLEALNSRLVNLKSSNRSPQYKWWFPYLFIAPFFLGFIVFHLAPILYSFYISLTDWSGLNRPVFIGTSNYSMLIRDELFYIALANTVKIVVIFSTILVSLSLIGAYIVQRKMIKGGLFYQTVFFLPYITTPIAVGLLFKALFNGNFGFVNSALLKLHIISQPIDWLNNSSYTAWIISLMIIWQSVGYGMVILMSGLRGISKEIYEAAIIDGAGAVQTFFRITIPLLRPILTFLIITLVIWGLQIFDETFLLYGPAGGADFSALTMVSYLYTVAFKDGHFGYGAAIGYALSVIIMVFTLIILRLLSGKRELSI